MHSVPQDDIYSDQTDFDTIDEEDPQRAPIAESPVQIIESPPLDLICPPTPEVEGGQKEEENVDEGEENRPPKAVKRKKMRVIFVVILSGFSNTTFNAEEAEKLKNALMLATKDLGTFVVYSG